MSEQTVNEWIDGFETGHAVGAVEGQKIIFDGLIDGLVFGVVVGFGYLTMKGLSEFLTERWAKEGETRDDLSPGL